jgi:hypothetical protein
MSPTMKVLSAVNVIWYFILADDLDCNSPSKAPLAEDCRSCRARNPSPSGLRIVEPTEGTDELVLLLVLGCRVCL